MAQEQKSPDSIEGEIEQTRERLASTIDQLVYRASPKTIVRREVAGIKATFVDPQGHPRTDLSTCRRSLPRPSVSAPGSVRVRRHDEPQLAWGFPTCAGTAEMGPRPFAVLPRFVLIVGHAPRSSPWGLGSIA